MAEHVYIEPRERHPSLDDPLWRRTTSLMIALGCYTDEQIAKTLKVPVTVVRDFQREHGAKVVIGTLRKIVWAQRSAAELLASDIERNIQFLVDLRDGFIDGRVVTAEDEKMVRGRVEAAKILIDRQAPKRVTQVGQVEGRPVIDITPAQEARMKHLLEGLSAPLQLPAAGAGAGGEGEDE